MCEIPGLHSLMPTLMVYVQIMPHGGVFPCADYLDGALVVPVKLRRELLAQDDLEQVQPRD